MSKTYLDVPYQDKDAAKALGARWDPALRKWYVAGELALTPFAPWLPAAGSTSGSPSFLASSLASATSSELALGTPQYAQELTTAKKTLSLSQLLHGVERAIAQAFTEGAWTVVEVVRVQSKNAHVYLELAERSPEGRVLATARATIWASTANRILPAFERATTASIAAGIKLLVRAKPAFKPQFGFSLDIDAIDPDYTLGDLEARKREIRTRLQQEGIFTANKQLASPWDFHAVLVVAPQGAAGLGDFQAEASRLERYGLCRFVYAHSRFQGEGAAQEIRQVLRTGLAQMQDASEPCDLVVILRGGGAVNDLAWLNDYGLAKALCTLPLPVWTGIGHERDSTILDEVAHTRFDTPSKVIHGIEQVIRQRAREAQAHFEAVLAISDRAVRLTQGRITQSLSTIQTNALRQVAWAREASAEVMGSLRLDAISTLHHAKRESREALNEVRHGVLQCLADAKRNTPARLTEIQSGARFAIDTARRASQTALAALRDRSHLDVQRSREDLRSRMRDLSTSANRVVTHAHTASTALFREVAGQGPEKTLGRGFAIVRDTAGKPVTSVQETEPGQALEIEFRDGRVNTRTT